MLSNLVLVAWAVMASPGDPAADLVVLVDPGKADEFWPAAKALAALHHTTPKRIDAKNVRRAILELRSSRPRHVAFVMPPEVIDVDLAHEILEASIELDTDPFPDFEYGFVTGKDGAAASRFVEHIAAAWKREFGKAAGTFTGGDRFERRKPDAPERNTNAFGFTFKGRWASAKEGAAARAETAREALADLAGLDVLLFYSHGSPRGMAWCFSGEEFTQWRLNLSPAILFNCACYNGAPSRWFFSTSGKPRDQGPTPRAQSVTLALLDSGISAYFAGIDNWHGILADQAFLNVVDDGLSLGGAAKRHYDRVALEFLPQRMRFEPMVKLKSAPDRAESQRGAGVSTILYGDPSLAPYATSACRTGFAELAPLEGGKVRVRIGLHAIRPDAQTGTHALVMRDRLLSYYRDDKDLAMEIYRVVPLPGDSRKPPKLEIVSARAGEEDVPTAEPVTAIEETPDGRFLHVLVPLEATVDSATYTTITRNGITIELTGTL